MQSVMETASPSRLPHREVTEAVVSVSSSNRHCRIPSVFNLPALNSATFGSKRCELRDPARGGGGGGGDGMGDSMGGGGGGKDMSRTLKNGAKTCSIVMSASSRRNRSTETGNKTSVERLHELQTN